MCKWGGWGRVGEVVFVENELGWDTTLPGNGMEFSHDHLIAYKRAQPASTAPAWGSAVGPCIDAATPGLRTFCFQVFDVIDDAYWYCYHACVWPCLIVVSLLAHPRIPPHPHHPRLSV